MNPILKGFKSCSHLLCCPWFKAPTSTLASWGPCFISCKIIFQDDQVRACHLSAQTFLCSIHSKKSILGSPQDGPKHLSNPLSQLGISVCSPGPSALPPASVPWVLCKRLCPIEYPLPRFLCSRHIHRRGSAPSMPKFCVPLSLKKWDLLKAPCYKYPQCSTTHPTSLGSNAVQVIQRHVKSARFSNCPFQTTFAHASDAFKLLGV